MRRPAGDARALAPRQAAASSSCGFGSWALEELNRRYPGDHEVEYQLACVYSDSATVAQTDVLDPRLIALYEKALAMQRSLPRADPDHALRYWRGVFVNTHNIGRNRYANGEYAAALSESCEAAAAAERGTRPTELEPAALSDRHEGRRGARADGPA